MLATFRAAKVVKGKIAKRSTRVFSILCSWVVGDFKSKASARVNSLSGGNYMGALNAP
jgi:hypothetical protein